MLNWTISLYITYAERADLMRAAEYRRSSPSQIVRDALHFYFSRKYNKIDRIYTTPNTRRIPKRKYTVRVPREIKAATFITAARMRVSMNTFVRHVIAIYISHLNKLVKYGNIATYSSPQPSRITTFVRRLRGMYHANTVTLNELKSLMKMAESLIDYENMDKVHDMLNELFTKMKRKGRSIIRGEYLREIIEFVIPRFTIIAEPAMEQVVSVPIISSKPVEPPPPRIHIYPSHICTDDEEDEKLVLRKKIQCISQEEYMRMIRRGMPPA